MEDKKLIRPFIYLKNNQCPICEGSIELIETEICVAELDQRGFPVGEDSCFDATLRCTKCGREYPAAKKGMYFYIKSEAEPIQIKNVKEYNPFYSNVIH